VSQRVELQTEVIKGDPATIVLGKPEEKPARIHRERPKPHRTAIHILADIRLRMQELKPFVDEYPALEEADRVLRGI
jgi:5,10-methenyltetrahydromethanopterin hydrogenase